MLYAVCYDIQDDRRRLKIAATLKDFGTRVQRSVFEVRLNDRDLKRLKRRLEAHLHPEEDSLRLYPLCGACETKIHILGWGEVTEDPEVFIV